MLLAIDVGNTNMVYGIYEGETLTHSFRLMTTPCPGMKRPQSSP